MTKKIASWTIYAVVIGLLVYGAVNRTAVKSDQGSLYGGSHSADQPAQNRSGVGNSVNKREFGNSDHVEITADHDWVELSGVVLEYDSRRLVVQVDNFDEVEVAGRAWRFVQENGYQPSLGNQLLMSGFYEDNEYKMASMIDLNASQTILIRDVSGQPLWR